MSNIDLRYEVDELESFPGQEMLTYIFVSKGQNHEEDVVKVIQYAYVQDYEKRAVFNLGFGDMDLRAGGINDEAMTGNGDVYRVFNTVLSTIPSFFERFPDRMIAVQGSDGREAFEAACRETCERDCGESCHNYNRRMKTYCAYVTRKYSEFETSYEFLGGKRNKDNWFDFEAFMPGKLYDSIMVFEKKS